MFVWLISDKIYSIIGNWEKCHYRIIVLFIVLHCTYGFWAENKILHRSSLLVPFSQFIHFACIRTHMFGPSGNFNYNKLIHLLNCKKLFSICHQLTSHLFYLLCEEPYYVHALSKFLIHSQYDYMYVFMHCTPCYTYICIRNPIWNFYFSFLFMDRFAFWCKHQRYIRTDWSVHATFLSDFEFTAHEYDLCPIHVVCWLHHVISSFFSASVFQVLHAWFNLSIKLILF